MLQGTTHSAKQFSKGQSKVEDAADESWSDNVKAWTDLTTPELLAAATDRPAWRRMSASSVLRPPTI